MSPNLVAFLASLLFGVVVFPWSATLRRLGPAAVFVFTGSAYVLAGIAITWAHGGWQGKLSNSSLGLALVTALMYLAALMCCNYAFAHPRVNLPVAAAITAAYPAWTALISVIVMKQRLSFNETVFLLMVIVGLVGLGLSSRQVN